ncbi:hypothetical protein SEA_PAULODIABOLI_93 [Microbacterium phage PauloDiaboli]|nr:hypothetical protein SEA_PAULODIABOLI_93 [Microbacterium phage PauloDiaboli]QWY83943.1 hypothetical protein SEA_A3WALLY_93 [Microbacterium phage A3Wally]
MVLSTPVGAAVSNYNIPDENLTLVNMMDRLLDRVVGVYEQAGIPLPTRRFWMLSGEVPEDCEQLVVTFVQSYLGAPGDSAADAQQCNSPRTGVFNIWVTRNHPVGEAGKAVAADRIIEASKWGAIDAYTLMWALEDLSTLDDGFKGPGVIATVNVSPPNGGVQSTVLNISTMIG